MTTMTTLTKKKTAQAILLRATRRAAHRLRQSEPDVVTIANQLRQTAALALADLRDGATR